MYGCSLFQLKGVKSSTWKIVAEMFPSYSQLVNFFFANHVKCKVKNSLFWKIINISDDFPYIKHNLLKYTFLNGAGGCQCLDRISNRKSGVPFVERGWEMRSGGGRPGHPPLYLLNPCLSALYEYNSGGSLYDRRGKKSWTHFIWVDLLLFSHP